jgi:hypothetical protein
VAGGCGRLDFQSAPGFGRPIEVQLGEIKMADQRPPAGTEPLVRFAHPLRDQLRRLPGGDARATAANES